MRGFPRPSSGRSATVPPLIRTALLHEFRGLPRNYSVLGFTIGAAFVHVSIGIRTWLLAAGRTLLPSLGLVCAVGPRIRDRLSGRDRRCERVLDPFRDADAA